MNFLSLGVKMHCISFGKAPSATLPQSTSNQTYPLQTHTHIYPFSVPAEPQRPEHTWVSAAMPIGTQHRCTT